MLIACIILWPIFPFIYLAFYFYILIHILKAKKMLKKLVGAHLFIWRKLWAINKSSSSCRLAAKMSYDFSKIYTYFLRYLIYQKLALAIEKLFSLLHMQAFICSTVVKNLNA